MSNDADSPQATPSRLIDAAAVLEAVGHDLRDPINAIVGMARLALETSLTPQQRDYIEKAHQAAQTLQSIAHDIRDYSSLQASTLTLESIPFSLEEVLEHVSRTVAPLAQRKGVELVLQHPLYQECCALRCAGAQQLCHLVGDPIRLGQVLVQLIGHAVQFTALGEVCLNIQPHTLLPDCAVLHFEVVSSADTPPKTRHHQPAWDSVPLGLRLSRALLAQMGGTLTTERLLYGGTRLAFTVRVQRAPLLAQTPPADPPIPQGLVLVVQHNESARHALASMLQRLGYQAQLFASVCSALPWAQTQTSPAQVILIDWDLPDVSAVQAGIALRAVASMAQAPVLIMGASSHRDTAAKHAAHDNAPLDGWLDKPVLPSALQRALEQALCALPPPLDACSAADTRGLRVLGVNMAEGLRSTRGNAALLEQLLRDLVQSHSQDAHLILSAYHQGQVPQAHQLVHTLKGSAAMLGAHTVLQATRALESALRTAADSETMTISVATCCHRLDTALRALERAVHDWPTDSDSTTGSSAPSCLHPDPELRSALRPLIAQHNPRAADLLRTWLQRHVLAAPPWTLAMQQLDSLEFAAAAQTLAPWWDGTPPIPEFRKHDNHVPS